MRVMVFGASGFLGSRLTPYLTDNSFEVLTIGRSLGQDFNIDPTDSRAILELLDHIKPDCIVNLAAATNVDHCESDVSLAYMSNVAIPAAISDAITQKVNLKIQFIHISTDQVYSGTGPHSEGVVKPVNVY